MTLSFTKKWPKSMGELAGQPNYFTSKIMKSMWDHYGQQTTDFVWDRPKEQQRRFDEIEPFEYLTIHETQLLRPKLHTIREDPSDRWSAGRDIHFVINNRTKNRFQFAPVIKCVSVQEIEIIHGHYSAVVGIDGKFFGEIWHHGLDDIYEYTNDLKQLAINDGFPSVEAFFQYFNTDFKGKIIHWTDLKY